MLRARVTDAQRKPASTNAAAAALLEQIADDLRTEEPYPARRIAAYRRAAAAIRDTPLQVEDLWRSGRDTALASIPGVTTPVAHVIGDLIATKRLRLTDVRSRAKPARR